MKRKVILLLLCLSFLGALYCALGVLQAGSIFAGERAELNLKLWGGLFLGCGAVFLGCASFLVLRRLRKT
jgi:hypothetical protein